MMHTKEATMNGLCKDHIVKLWLVVYSEAMKIATSQGHNNKNGEVEGPSAKG